MSILIAGNGLVAKILSIKLKQSGISSQILEGDPKHFQNIRTITLNPASIDFLKSLDLGISKAEVQDIYVYDAEGSGRISFSSDDISEDYLAKVVFYDELNNALARHNFNFFSKNDFEQNKKSTDLVIYCDSNQQNMLGVKEAQSYEQIGHTFLVSSNDLSDNSAIQYFYKNEIFAIMPTNKNNLFTVVWSIPKAHASSDKESVKRSLSKISKKFNLKLELESEIVSFPLSHHHTKDYVKPGQCVLADAAHSIHPLAGQGLNLGIADASVLLEELVRARNANLSFGDISVLKRYEIRRRTINKSMLSGINLLNGLFKADNLYLRFVRNRGLSLVDNIPQLKKFFIKNAIGEIRF